MYNFIIIVEFRWNYDSFIFNSVIFVYMYLHTFKTVTFKVYLQCYAQKSKYVHTLLI